MTSAMPELSREHLLDTAGQLSFDRALDYLDRVSGRRFSDGWVYATVSGRARYRVQLTDEGAFSWACDCPWAGEGNCCKHVVAVGLVHLYEREHGEPSLEVPSIERHLRSLDHESIVGLLLAEAEHSPALTLELEARAAVAADEPKVLHALFESALHLSDPVPHEQAAEYARAVHSAADAVQALEEGEQTEAAAELIDAVCAYTEEAEDLVEDLDGEVDTALDRLRA